MHSRVTWKGIESPIRIIKISHSGVILTRSLPPPPHDQVQWPPRCVWRRTNFIFFPSISRGPEFLNIIYCSRVIIISPHLIISFMHPPMDHHE